MINNFNKYLNMEIIGSIINVILGIIFIINPHTSLKVLSSVFAIMLILYGSFRIISSLKNDFYFIIWE